MSRDGNYVACATVSQSHTVINKLCQYAVPVYKYDNLEIISDNEIQFTINDQTFPWDITDGNKR